MSRPSPSPAVFTIPECAEHLRVSPSTVRRAIATGQLPAFRLGRRLLIPRERLQRLLTEQDGSAPARGGAPS